jgi:hypothetical protein
MADAGDGQVLVTKQKKLVVDGLSARDVWVGWLHGVMVQSFKYL